MKYNKIILVTVFFALIVFSGCTTIQQYPSGVPVENNGGIPVNVQDQTTRPFSIQLNQVLDNSSYSIATSPTIDSHEVTLNSVVGLSTGTKIAFSEQNGMPQLYFGFITSIAGNTITMNAPVPFAFTSAGCSVFTFDNQLNVDGSTTEQVFSLVNFFNESVDITRIIFKCTDNVEMNDGLFCGTDMLDRGIEFRKYSNDGYYINYFNVRNNAKWGLLAFDIEYTDNGKPPDDTYGFGSRLTYAGQSKHGVVIRLEPGERIELVVQDDLTDISGASIMAEGHFTQE